MAEFDTLHPIMLLANVKLLNSCSWSELVTSSPKLSGSTGWKTADDGSLPWWWW